MDFRGYYVFPQIVFWGYYFNQEFLQLKLKDFKQGRKYDKEQRLIVIMNYYTNYEFITLKD